jgi:predicted TPR repeat methyltransferase
VYDDIVVDPCHDAIAAFLDELWDDGVHDVLDVACGTGLLAARLIGRGYRVVGTDASEEMLARARDLLGPDVELIRTSLSDLEVDGPFDAVVCTLDGITYLEPTQLPETFAAFADRLRPGGWLVFDVHTDAMMAFTQSRPEVTGEKDGYRFTITSTVDADARASDTRIEITPPDGTLWGERHRQYFHAALDVRAALAGAGFTVTAVRDGYSERPADESTYTATWIARRPDARA